MRQLCNYLCVKSSVIAPKTNDQYLDTSEQELNPRDSEQDSEPDSTQLDKIMKYEKSEIDRAIKSSHNKTKNHQQNCYNL